MSHIDEVDEVKLITKYAKQRIQSENQQRVNDTIAKFRKNESFWTTCEQIWPELLKQIKQRACEGDSKLTFRLDGEHLKGTPIDVDPSPDICYSLLHDIRTALVYYILSKKFNARELDVMGHYNGQHIEIHW